MAVRRRVRLALRLVLALIWIALALVLLEVFARVGFRSVDRSNPRVVEYRRVLEVYDDQEATLWEVPYKRYKKNAELIVEDGEDIYHITTNNLGYRGDEIALPRPEGVFRIVCVGGSTTVGGWTDDTTYPAFLERELNRRFAGTLEIEVVNAGISGMASDGERSKARDYLALEPNLIVHYNVVNDLAWRVYPALRKEAGWLRGVLRRSEFVRRYVGGWIEPPEDRLLEHLEATTLRNLRDLGHDARAAGVDFALASFAYPDETRASEELANFLDHNAVTYWGLRETSFDGYRRAVQAYNRELAGMAAEAGFIYLPVAEGFVGMETHFIDICHLDEEGMRTKAEVFADALEPYLAARVPAP
jgi:lysophospholipase L1-like esterase